jgi:hypothetical protein
MAAGIAALQLEDFDVLVRLDLKHRRAVIEPKV